MSTSSQKEWVRCFDAEGKPDKFLLGGKGAGVSEMTQAGLPVPPGFTITTEACKHFLTNGEEFPERMWEETLEELEVLEEKMGKHLGDSDDPLLVSVRSGAAFSMPGMMDTVLNLGLNDETVEGLALNTGNYRFALDSYRRFIQMYGNIVLGISNNYFEERLQDIKDQFEAAEDGDLNEPALYLVISEYKKIVQEITGMEFPSDPKEQLRRAIGAVFTSWNGRRAVAYREAKGIPHDLGTAVNIQAMVFGNMGENSATGVAFTRNPETGEVELYGEYLPNAQGEDVVRGIRTPIPLSLLAANMPEVYVQFARIASQLEEKFGDIQDIEFTVQEGQLWLLQRRNGQRSAMAQVRFTVDMVDEGKLSKEEAIARVSPTDIEKLLLPQFSLKDKKGATEQGRLFTIGIGASPGAAVGQAVFDADTAERLGIAGQRVILVRPETVPDDVHGMIKAQGILTSRGGKTSHAAVVARGWGKPAVVGAQSINVDVNNRNMVINGLAVSEGDWISIDGATGEVFAGEIKLTTPDLKKNLELARLLEWSDEIARVKVWANADTPEDAKRAREFGAQGIGLCRTEHMFMQQERLPWMQKMILSAETRNEGYFTSLDHLLQMQREDFYGILKAMDSLPVVIRLLDPPLHEFLPKWEDLIRGGVKDSKGLLEIVEKLRESNPMMGLRGDRLGIMYPEINEMQVRAILEAACRLKREGFDPKPKIMIPLVSHVNELTVVQSQLEYVASAVMAEHGVSVEYKFGTMIEVPRAALTAHEIAKYAEFFSFGTNDLTQFTFAFSRDDAEGKFLPKYLNQGILPISPFQTIDQDGVGRLVRLAVKEGREARPDLEVGVCGEHGGDPDSIAFFDDAGLDYVSCSPYRVQVARLAAAQSRLSKKGEDSSS